MVALGCAISRGVNGGQEVVRSLHTHIEIEPSADRQRAGAVERKGEVVGAMRMHKACCPLSDLMRMSRGIVSSRWRYV